MTSQRLTLGILWAGWFCLAVLMTSLILSSPDRGPLILPTTQCEALTQLNLTYAPYPGFCRYQGHVKFMGRNIQLDRQIEIPRSGFLAYEPIASPHSLEAFLNSFSSKGFQP